MSGQVTFVWPSSQRERYQGYILYTFCYLDYLVKLLLISSSYFIWDINSPNCRLFSALNFLLIKPYYLLSTLWFCSREITVVWRSPARLFIILFNSIHSAREFYFRYLSRYMNPPPVLTIHPDSLIYSCFCFVPIKYLPELSFTIGKNVASSMSRASLYSYMISLCSRSQSLTLWKCSSLSKRSWLRKDSSTRLISKSTGSLLPIDFSDELLRMR